MKNSFLIIFIFIMINGSFLCSAENDLKISGDFPGGNIEVVSMKGNSATLKILPRGTSDKPFYWAFRLDDAQGKTVKFRFAEGAPLGTRGPAVSRDNGRTWSWLSSPGASAVEFKDTLGPDDTSVIYAMGMLYRQSDFDRFYALIEGKANLVKEVLCETEKGRKAEMLRFGNTGGKARYSVLLTARHHAREMTASHVLEGFLAEIFSGSDAGKYLLENVDFAVVPFMDKDGVENGEEGKNRIPHDHNRDYQKKIYASVIALTKFAPSWSAERKLVAFDLHCPGLRGRAAERVFFFCNKEGSQAKESKKYFEIFEKIHAGGAIPYKESNNIYNAPNRGMSRCWLNERPNAIFAATLEIPFANSDNQPITQKSSREFGHDLAKALKVYLQSAEKH